MENLAKTSVSVFVRFLIGGAISAFLLMIVVAFKAGEGDPGLLGAIIIGPILVFIPGGVLGVILSSFILVSTKTISVKQCFIEVGVLGFIVTMAFYINNSMHIINF